MPTLRTYGQSFPKRTNTKTYVLNALFAWTQAQKDKMHAVFMFLVYGEGQTHKHNILSTLVVQTQARLTKNTHPGTTNRHIF